ncbi:MAG: hypothetical protein D4Q77_00915 [Methanothrix sp.]|nr:MAG: hypothetical protein D4Q77_00915 [Methanothrix sp.]
MLGLNEDLVERSFEEMQENMENLLTDSKRLRRDAADLLIRSDEVRNKSIDIRNQDTDLAEDLWMESERLRDQSKEAMRLSVDNEVKAGDIKHRIKIHDLIENVIDEADEVWKGALRARRL